MYDALMKLHYLESRGLKPDEVDTIPSTTLSVWNMVDSEEAKKRKIESNTG